VLDKPPFDYTAPKNVCPHRKYNVLPDDTVILAG
jgi:hypothetical protein